MKTMVPFLGIWQVLGCHIFRVTISQIRLKLSCSVPPAFKKKKKLAKDYFDMLDYFTVIDIIFN